MSKVENFVGYNNRGSSLSWGNDRYFTEHYKEWERQHPGELIFGPIIKYTWQVDGKNYELLTPRNDGFDLLPDARGFLLFEKKLSAPTIFCYWMRMARSGCALMCRGA
jgi:hypothetical protein